MPSLKIEEVDCEEWAAGGEDWVVSLTSAWIASGSAQSRSVSWLVAFSFSMEPLEATGSLLALVVPLLVAVSFSVEFPEITLSLVTGHCWH